MKKNNYPTAKDLNLNFDDPETLAKFRDFMHFVQEDETLSRATQTALIRNIHSMEHFKSLTIEKIKRMRGIGIGRLQEVIDFAKRHGIVLSEKDNILTENSDDDASMDI